VENGAPQSGPVLQVALNLPRHQLYDYLPPAGADGDAIPVGSRVCVPFGARTAVGFVVGAADRSRHAPQRLRRIAALLDPLPLLDAPLLRLLQWTAQYYHHPLGEVIAGALPKALRGTAPALALTEYWLASQAGLAALREGAPARAPRQRALLERLAQAPEGVAAAVLDEAAAPWREAARALAARGWASSAQLSAVAVAAAARDGPDGSDAPEGCNRPDRAASPPGPPLSAAQAAAMERIDAAAGTFAAFVLDGATGSGKTEVYLRCAAHALARGFSVLVLVPEIALTPQLVERFRARLPQELVVLHSALSDGERLAAWRAARAGQARIVLGTRSAVFAPLPRCGLLIVDEEHDASYKQQEAGCRYSARDVAVARAQQAGIPVVLGSATPALETLHNGLTGRYQSLHLPRRSDQAEAPRLVLIDLRVHPVTQGLAAPSLEAIRRHLAAEGQVLVYINRRGYAPTLLCTACGWIAPCRSCDAHLTVHRAAAELRCHHCGAREALPSRCVRCGFAVKPAGQGTERVEETLRLQFPGTGLTRLDRDTAASHSDLEALMQSMLSGAARILVGTQMVTKGHHFPGVSLVVVLNADHGLFSTDYRAAERLAQTIVQVAGRAGRERTRGEVLIQTEYPEHPLLRSLLDSGYRGFASAALAERESACWPPFSRLALLRASAPSGDHALEFLAAARARAPAHPGVRVLGPVAAAMARRAERYYAQLLVESAERGALHRFLDAWLPEVAELPERRRVRYALDVDPIDIQ
jgi:primosomal protein N' (replication factor Y)